MSEASSGGEAGGSPLRPASARAWKLEVPFAGPDPSRSPRPPVPAHVRSRVGLCLGSGPSGLPFTPPRLAPGGRGAPGVRARRGPPAPARARAVRRVGLLPGLRPSGLPLALPRLVPRGRQGLLWDRSRSPLPPPPRRRLASGRRGLRRPPAASEGWLSLDGLFRTPFSGRLSLNVFLSSFCTSFSRKSLSLCLSLCPLLDVFLFMNFFGRPSFLPRSCVDASLTVSLFFSGLHSLYVSPTRLHFDVLFFTSPSASPWILFWLLLRGPWTLF